MTIQEIQYTLQIMNNANIKGQNSVFHAQLMSKLSMQLQEQVNQNQNVQEMAEDADRNT